MRPASLLAAMALLAVAACAGEGDEPGARPTLTDAPRATRSQPSCPAPKATKPVWPKEVPDIIPKPPGLKIEKVDQSKGNVTQVRTMVPTSLTAAVGFIIKEFPKAGFTLGRGDAEASEADAPFQRGEALRGLVRVFATDQECSTLWLFAVVRNTNAPYDISYTPPPSSTPLPFG